VTLVGPGSPRKEQADGQKIQKIMPEAKKYPTLANKELSPTVETSTIT